MKSKQGPRVRFAPAPTGMMHLGNIRTALMNYLLSHQKQGTFILRIEDTDLERNFDPNAQHIQSDLSWLGLMYDEGPGKEDKVLAPYFQSQRNAIYQKELQTCIEKKLVYRCFCSAEDLEKKRQRQIALKQPPRYDRTCLVLSAEVSADRAQKEPFIWRMKVNPEETVTIHDLAHGEITFDLKNFYDFPVTRQDGTVTFMFANFIDDVLMKIDYVIRGEDHLSNTAGQAFMYRAYGAKLPLFWHMPILCNVDGKKLSKRDFGFSLQDLKESGFLPEAIVNYLAIIGGSFKNEIMSMDELIATLNFDHISTTGQIKYDVEKLRWVNHKWIGKLSLQELTRRTLPFLHKAYPHTVELSVETIETVLSYVQQEMVTLSDSVGLLSFYFDKPVYEKHIAQTVASLETIDAVKIIVKKSFAAATKDACLMTAKEEAKLKTINIKELFCFIRYALTGSVKGIGISELIDIVGYERAQKTIKDFLESDLF